MIRRLTAAFEPGALVALAGLCLLAALLSGAGACGARVPPAPAPIPCDEEAPYESQILDDYEPGFSGFGWYAYGDTTPGALQSPATAGQLPHVPIEDGGRCGSQYAAYLVSRGFDDYGSGWGTYSVGAVQAVDGGPCEYPDGAQGVCAIDVSAYEGVRFWARSHPGPLPDGAMDPPGRPATKGVTLEIADKTVFSSVDGVCTPYDASASINGTYAQPVNANGVTGGGIATAFPPAGACGLYFTRAVTVTDAWQLYTIPWDEFDQQAQPRRTPSRFDPSTFSQLLIVVPKEAQLSLWFDDFGVYRRRAGDGGEGGP